MELKNTFPDKPISEAKQTEIKRMKNPVKFHPNLPAYSSRSVARLETLMHTRFLELKLVEHDTDKLLIRIAEEFNTPLTFARKVLSNATAIEVLKQSKEAFLKEVVGAKIPVLKEIVGLSLHSVREYLVNLKDNPGNISNLSINEIKALASISTELNQMLRLELGEPTQNISIDNQNMVPIININIEHESPSIVVSSQ